MPRFALVVISTILILSPVAARASDDTIWQDDKSTHFIVYYEESSSFAGEVISASENHYQDMIRYFGSLPQSNFWTWENRCKIYIYASRSNYMERTNQPEWSSGFADVKRRAIVSYEDAPDFIDSVLPHEMAHLIFREFIEVGNRQVPRWLDEGFAIAQEERIRVSLDQAVKKAIKSNSTIALRDLGQIGSLHVRPAEQAKLFYAQAQSLTRFLIEKRDSSYFINFCRLLRDGERLEDALRKSYGQDFPTLEAFEKSWKKYVLNS